MIRIKVNQNLKSNVVILLVDLTTVIVDFVIIYLNIKLLKTS